MKEDRTKIFLIEGNADEAERLRRLLRADGWDIPILESLRPPDAPLDSEDGAVRLSSQDSDLPGAATLPPNLTREAIDQDLARRLSELQVLLSVASAGAEMASEDAIIEQTTRIIGESIYPDNFGVLLLDERLSMLFTHPSYHERKEALSHQPIPLGEGICGRVALTGQPLRVADVSQEPNYLAVDPRTQSEICVPLKVDNQIIGVVNAESSRLDCFTPADERFLLTIANQLATAIEKVRLLGAERQQRTRAQTLERLGQALNSTLDLPELLKMICKESAQLFNAQAAYIWLVQNQGLLGLAAFGRDAEKFLVKEIPLEDPHALGARVVREKKSLYANDVRQSDLAHQVDIRSASQVSLLGVPLLKDSEAMGALVIQKTQATYTTNDLESAQALGTHAAIAIGNARLFEEERRRRKEAESLRQATTGLISTLDLQEVLDRILLFLEQSVPYDTACIFLKKGDNLVAVAGRNFPNPEEVLNRAYPLANDLLAEEIERTGAPLILEDVQADTRFKGWGGTDYVHGWMGVPLVVRAKVIGLLTLDSRQIGAYGIPEAELAQALANQAAMAIDHAHLFEESQRQRLELMGLYETALAVSSVLVPEALLARVRELVMRMLSPDSFGLFLYHPERAEYEVSLAIENGRDLPAMVGETYSLEAGGLTAWVLSNRQPLLITDLEKASPAFKPIHITRPARTWLGVPLIARDRLIGAISVQSFQPEAFSPADRRYLESLAAQFAIAIENAHLFDRARQGVTRQEAINKIVATAAGGTELEPILHTTLEQGLIALGVRSGMIWLGDIQDSQGIPSHFYEKFSAKLNKEGLDLEAITATTVINDWRKVEKGHFLYPFANLFLGQRFEAILLVPILSRGEKVGGIGFFATERMYWSAEEVALAEVIGKQIGTAIERLRLYLQAQDAIEESQARIAELTGLTEVSSALRGAASVGEISQTLAEEAARLVNADQVVLYLLDETRSRLVTFGITESTKKSDTPPTSPEKVLGLRSPTPEKTPDLNIFSWEHLGQFGAGLCLPLKTTSGDALGMLIASRSGLESGESPVHFHRQEERLLIALSEIAANALQRAKSHEELESAYLQTVLSLAKTMDARDTYTSDHSQRLAEWAAAVAAKMGCGEAEIQAIRWAALLHDIGKIGVPDHILLKPGPLTEEEWSLMRRHPEIGSEIIAPVQSLAPVAPLIRAHHEKYDGSGYPDRLAGEEIPLGARIMAVADAYSAMTDERVYRKAISHQAAVEELARCAGSQFDPLIVTVFLEVLSEQKGQ